MKIVDKELYNMWYKELWNLSEKLIPYYDIDKVKDWAVFVWTKDTEEKEGKNVFDIEEKEIVFYDKNHIIKEEAKPIIDEIQNHFKNRYYRKAERR